MIVVEDQGSGIAPEMLPNLFVFGMSTKGESGNGMGLWAVKKLVTRNGGRVSVDSMLGRGTRFDVYWPRKLPPEAAEREKFAAFATAQ